MPVASDNQPLPDLAANSCSKCQRSVAGLIFFEVKNEHAHEGGEEPPVEIVCQTCNAGAPKTWRWDEGPLYIPVHSNEAADEYGFRPYPNWNREPYMPSSYFKSIVLTEDKKECVKCTYLPMIFSTTTCERARKMVMKRSTRRSIVGNPHVELRMCLPCVSSVGKNYAKLLEEGEPLLARFEVPRTDGVNLILDTSCALMESRVTPVTHAEKKVMLKKQERDEKRSYKKPDKRRYPYGKIIVTMVLPDGSPSSTPQQDEKEQPKDKKAEAVKKVGAREKKKQNKKKGQKNQNTATSGTDVVDGDEVQSTKSENDHVAIEENSNDKSLVVVERIKEAKGAIETGDIDNGSEPTEFAEDKTAMKDTSSVDPPAVLERIRGKRFIIAQKRRVEIPLVIAARIFDRPINNLSPKEMNDLLHDSKEGMIGCHWIYATVSQQN